MTWGTYPAQATETDKATQPGRSEEGDDHDEQVEDVSVNEYPPARCQKELDDVLQGEQRPDDIVDDGEGEGDRTVKRAHQRYQQDWYP